MEDLPFDIPDNWTWIRLKSFSNIYNGNSINEEEKRKKYMGVEGYDFIATKDVTFERTICYNNGVNIPYDTNFKIAPANKILMCIEGGSAGRKIAITNKEVCFGNKLACFDAFIVSDAYLFNVLQSNEFLLIFKASLTGIIGGVSINTLKDFIIPLPPLKEQERIVKKINSFEPLITQYSIAEEKLSMLEKEFPEKLKKSILQYAIEGKLVKQDPNDEPASVLLERIKAEKEKLIKEGKIKRDKNESYIYQGDDKNYYEKIGKKEPEKLKDLPFVIPDSWTWVRLNSISTISAGGTPDRGNPKYWNGNIPWLKISDITSSNKYVNKSSERITEEGMNNSSAKLMRRGTILYTIFATIGEVGILNFEATCNQAIAGISTYLKSIDEYLYLLLVNLQDYMKSISKGCAQFNINQKILKETIIALPPLNEQRKIARKLDYIFNNLINC